MVIITGSRGCVGTALRKTMNSPYEENDLILGKDHRDIVGNTGTLIYLSSWSEQNESMRRPVKYIDNNLTSLAMILSNNSFDHVIFPSSIAVYDSEGDLNPSSVYGLTKLAGEHLVRMYCKNSWIFRFANIYGEADRRSVFYHLARCKTEGKVFPIYDKNGMVRDYISVEDAVCVINSALEGILRPGTYNVGTGKGMHMSELLEKLCNRLQVQYKHKELPEGITGGFVPVDNLLKVKRRNIEEEISVYFKKGEADVE